MVGVVKVVVLPALPDGKVHASLAYEWEVDPDEVAVVTPLPQARDRASILGLFKVVRGHTKIGMLVVEGDVDSVKRKFGRSE